MTVHLPLIAGGQNHCIVVLLANVTAGAVAQDQLDALLVWGCTFNAGQAAEHMAGNTGHFLTIKNAVDALDQVDVHHRIVGALVLSDQPLALGSALLVHQIGELRRKHFVDERAIIRRFQCRTAQHPIHLRRRVAIVQVDKRFGSTLPAPNDCDTHRLAFNAGLAAHALKVLGVMKHPRIVFQRLESGRNARRTTRADNHGARRAHMVLALAITGDDPQRFNLLLVQHRLDGQHFFAIPALRFKV